MKTNRRESDVKAAVHAYLDTRTDFFFWRANTGGALFGKAFVKFNVPGVSDFLGVQAVRTSYPPGASMPIIGRFTAIETKREGGGEQSDAQKLFQQNVENHGGLYVLADSVDIVVAALGPSDVFVVKKRKARIIPR